MSLNIPEYPKLIAIRHALEEGEKSGTAEYSLVGTEKGERGGDWGMGGLGERVG